MAQTPTFNGVAIFGLIDSLVTAENPRDQQRNAYPALDGVERLDGGRRGRATVVEGFLFGTAAGSGTQGLANAEALFRSYYDGNAYTLVDQLGQAWQPVVMERFEPHGRTSTDQFGRCFRRYRAEFTHNL